MENSCDSSFEDDELIINIGKRRNARELAELMKISAGINKIERRRSFGGYPQPKHDWDLTELTANLSNTSLSRQPLIDEETHIESAPGTFIDRVAEILDESVSGNTTYTTALETNSANTSKHLRDHVDIPGSDDIIPMQTFGQSALLDNCEATLYTSYNQTDIVTISDDEIDTDFLRYQGTQMKYEDITIEEDTDSDDCVILDSTEDEKSSTNVEDSANGNAEIAQSFASNASICFDDSLADIDMYLMKAAKQNDTSLQLPVTPEITRNASFRQELTPANNFKTPTSKSNMFKSNIPCKVNSKLRTKQEPFKLPQPIKKLQKPLASPYDNIVSPISNYINSAPLKSTNLRNTPTNKTPKTCKTMPANKSKFDYIASPIATYIKLSNQAGIKRKLEGNSQLPIKLPDDLFEESEKEYDPMSFIIREVIYVPATKQHMTFVPQQKLPNSIKKLIPNIETRVTVKHQERLNSGKENREHIIHKLNNVPDLTVDSSILSDDNISVLEIRRYT